MRRGEVWLVQFNPTIGHEQAGQRPALILSVDQFNASAADLVVVLPITSNPRKLPTRVRMSPPEGGLKTVSYVICEQPRAIAEARLSTRWGIVKPDTMVAVSDIVSLLLGLTPPHP
jgi:mRNA interferase MazF